MPSNLGRHGQQNRKIARTATSGGQSASSVWTVRRLGGTEEVQLSTDVSYDRLRQSCRRRRANPHSRHVDLGRRRLESDRHRHSHNAAQRPSTSGSSRAWGHCRDPEIRRTTPRPPKARKRDARFAYSYRSTDPKALGFVQPHKHGSGIAVARQDKDAVP